MAKTACVVGAGPGGLVAARMLLRHPAGVFDSVCIVEAQTAVGGLWPSSTPIVADGPSTTAAPPATASRQVDPLMLANQSRHTMHFADLAWEPEADHIPRAWHVGRYLRRYLDQVLAPLPGFHLRLGTRLVAAEPCSGPDESGWRLELESADAGLESAHFDHLVIATGCHGEPIFPDRALPKPQAVPVIHASQYRNLNQLLGHGPSSASSDGPIKGSILVVGGQISGVDISATIAAHLSAAEHAPAGQSAFPAASGLTVHHLIQRPLWILPMLTSPEPTAKAPPFLPLDFSVSNVNARPRPLANTQGHITEEAARVLHASFEQMLGTDQANYSPLLRIDDVAKAKPLYLAVSDWYSDFVRAGRITLSKGKLDLLRGTTAVVSAPDGTTTEVPDIVAVVLATGYDPSPSLSFFSAETLAKLHYSPRHTTQPLALAFHGTHHPDLPGLGFVGFYRSPYWCVMQLQARFLAELWSRPTDAQSESMRRKLDTDDSIRRTLALRDDPRLSQFPMGDYAWLVGDIAEALQLERVPTSTDSPRPLSLNGLPLDMLTPSGYDGGTREDARALAEAATSRQSAHELVTSALTTPRFVARAVFHSLLGAWRLDRVLDSRLPSHPSGRFTGTANFHLRDQTTDGVVCSSGGCAAARDGGRDQDDTDNHNSNGGSDGNNAALEHLYVEQGDFRADNGMAFGATRRYIWRYDDRRDVLSVWFTQPHDPTRAQNLFHEIVFDDADDFSKDTGWTAHAGHLCDKDYYDVRYRFTFAAVNLAEWSIEYTVRGPKKDYTIRGVYRR